MCKYARFLCLKFSFNTLSTGTTGYIGGDALFAIVAAHPEWEITCLARNTDKGAKIAAKYPSIRLVYGDLDSFDLLVEESKSADIVYHFANCDHEESAKAISQGLAHANKEVHWSKDPNKSTHPSRSPSWLDHIPLFS